MIIHGTELGIKLDGTIRSWRSFLPPVARELRSLLAQHRIQCVRIHQCSSQPVADAAAAQWHHGSTALRCVADLCHAALFGRQAGRPR